MFKLKINKGEYRGLWREIGIRIVSDIRCDNKFLTINLWKWYFEVEVIK